MSWPQDLATGVSKRGIGFHRGFSCQFPSHLMLQQIVCCVFVQISALLFHNMPEQNSVICKAALTNASTARGILELFWNIKVYLLQSQCTSLVNCNIQLLPHLLASCQKKLCKADSSTCFLRSWPLNMKPYGEWDGKTYFVFQLWSHFVMGCVSPFFFSICESEKHGRF